MSPMFKLEVRDGHLTGKSKVTVGFFGLAVLKVQVVTDSGDVIWRKCRNDREWEHCADHHERNER